MCVYVDLIPIFNLSVNIDFVWRALTHKVMLSSRPAVKTQILQQPILTGPTLFFMKRLSDVIHAKMYI